MANVTLSAQIAQVPFGSFEIEGLLLSDSDYAIAVPQICSIFSFDKNQASRDIKTLLGKDSPFDKARTTLNSKAVNVLRLKDFERLLAELSFKGNETAIAMVRALIGLSLTQLFSDAFGVKFEKEDRQKWMKERTTGIVIRRELTDAIRDWYDRNPYGSSRPMYVMIAQTTNGIYQALWGMDALDLEALLQCDRHKSRDSLSAKDLILLQRAEGNVMDYIDQDNVKPVDAVKAANIRAAKSSPTAK